MSVKELAWLGFRGGARIENTSELLCVCVRARAHVVGHVQLFATSWIVARQAPLSTGFSRQVY